VATDNVPVLDNMIAVTAKKGASSYWIVPPLWQMKPPVLRQTQWARPRQQTPFSILMALEDFLVRRIIVRGRSAGNDPSREEVSFRAVCFYIQASVQYLVGCVDGGFQAAKSRCEVGGRGGACERRSALQ
jgi:hypothetical protein